MVMWFVWVIWKEFILMKILQKAAQRPIKVHFFHINKYVGEMVIMNDLGWQMLFILCDLVWKVQKSHAVNREGCFKQLNFEWGKKNVLFWVKDDVKKGHVSMLSHLLWYWGGSIYPGSEVAPFTLIVRWSCLHWWWGGPVYPDSEVAPFTLIVRYPHLPS